MLAGANRTVVARAAALHQQLIRLLYDHLSVGPEAEVHDRAPLVAEEVELRQLTRESVEQKVVRMGLVHTSLLLVEALSACLVEGHR